MNEIYWTMHPEENELIPLDRRMLEMVRTLWFADDRTRTRTAVERGESFLILFQSDGSRLVRHVGVEETCAAIHSIFAHVSDSGEPAALVGLGAPDEELEAKFIVWYRSDVVDGAIYEFSFRSPGIPESGLDVASIQLIAVTCSEIP